MADPISDQFGKVRDMLGDSTGKNAQPVPQGPTKGYAAGINSSEILRQGENLTGGAGVNALNTGNTILGAGLDTTAQGLSTMQKPIDFFSAILSGDPTAIQEALAPTATTISNQYEQAKTAAQSSLPKGGFASTAIAGLPFAQAGKVGDAALKLQPEAATALAGLGKDQASIGATTAGLGEAEQGMGMQAIQQLIQAALGKMGVTRGITQNLSDVGNFISALV